MNGSVERLTSDTFLLEKRICGLPCQRKTGQGQTSYTRPQKGADTSWRERRAQKENRYQYGEIYGSIETGYLQKRGARRDRRRWAWREKASFGGGDPEEESYAWEKRK